MSDIPFTQARFQEPHWSPFAEEIVTRLRVTLAAKDRGYGRDTILTAPRTRPADTSAADLSAEHRKADEEKVEDEDDDLDWLKPLPGEAAAQDGGAEAAQPDHPVSGRQLQLVLRLAATFGDRETFLRCLAPGAVTILGGMVLEEVRPLQDLLWLGLVPPGHRIDLKPSRHIVERCDLLLLGPDTDGTGISNYALKGFHERLTDALMAPVPVLVLCPDEAAPSADLARYLPAPRQLAPLDRGIMLHHLRLAYPDAGTDLDALHAALPEDRQLAGLSTIGLHVALRAPDVMAAAGRLAEFLTPPADKNSGPRLEDISGEGEALSAARQLVADLGLWQQKKLVWADLCRSLLLYGSPGTGKTWLARGMGNSAGVSFIATSFAEWQAAGHLGDMLRTMRKSFADARKQAPAILFIDEIDAVGSREDSDRHASNYRMQVINGFLEQMDSISREEGVIVVGACNHPDRIDPAVLRAGRFDLKVEVPLPDAAVILGILCRHLGEAFSEEDLRDLARAASGASAAEVDAAVRKARAMVRSAGRALRLDDLRAQFAATGTTSDAWDRRAAVHECGHAITGTLLGTGEVLRVLLSRAGGQTTRRLIEQGGLVADLEAELAYTMAGRAAERLVFGDTCAGAGGPEQSDLARATKLAVSIDTLFGLGAYGPVWIDTPPEVLLRDPEARARIRVRLEAAEEQATTILAAHRPHLEAMAEALVRERELMGEALTAWLEPLRVSGLNAGRSEGGDEAGDERLAG
ncbi:AAA family ATPase [Pseudogemmobacter sonorensis]|uniref:AAA family ATPase n=1 Tax=Pseudogemmobacter sonorensis TaxID=2989681 RepID=UPI0036A52686